MRNFYLLTNITHNISLASKNVTSFRLFKFYLYCLNKIFRRRHEVVSLFLSVLNVRNKLQHGTRERSTKRFPYVGKHSRLFELNSKFRVTHVFITFFSWTLLSHSAMRSRCTYNNLPVQRKNR